MILNIAVIRGSVHSLYNPISDTATDFVRTGWAYDNHVLVVARICRELAIKYKANPDQAEAAGLLHDIGDSVMNRMDPKQDFVSKTLAIGILHEAGYSWQTAADFYELVIKPHSCKDGNLPQTLEGKICATADAIAHLEFGFYLHFLQNWHIYRPGGTYEDYVKWALAKIERDVTDKIFFEEERSEMLPYKDSLRLTISLNI